MKKLLSALFVVTLCMLAFPFFTYADVGPKPTLKVIAKNMPDAMCYLDLLVNYPPESIHQNITEAEKYDQELFGELKRYNVDGWRPAMVTGTMPPLFGDIICDMHNGQCILDFSYVGVPDDFKIIVVSADGKTVVSNVVKRKAFNSTVFFDYKTGSAAEKSAGWAYFIQFTSTCAATLAIEGFILLLFGFNFKNNWKPLVVINIFTQLLLTLIVFAAMYRIGTIPALLLYLPFEIVILMMEAVLFVKYLKQHSKTRRAAFAITANMASFVFGVLLMLKPWLQ